MGDHSPTPARFTAAASTVTFILRSEGGEIIELDPALQEIFRGELAWLWKAAFNQTPFVIST